MSYGLQISASGVAAAMYRQDVFANNLANVGTPGFKPDIPSAKPREAVRAEDHLPFLPSNKLLEKLGGGVLLNPNRVNFSGATLRDTGNPLDLGVRGSGFFAVRDEQDGLKDRVRLTRDGRFTLDANRRLVMATTGMPVLDDQNNAIVLDGSGAIKVDGDGTIQQGGRQVAKLKFVDVPDKDRLRKAGHSLFIEPSDASTSEAPAAGEVRQFAYEESGADEVMTLMDMTAASRDVDANLAMVQANDRLMDRAINGLGRVT